MWFNFKNQFLSGRIIYFYLFYFILTLLVANNFFFWDTIQLASSHAHFYFENNLKIDFLPNRIDSGHLPAFGYLLALVWKIFGVSLIVSHFFMLPFLLGIVYQMYRLCTIFFQGKEYLPMIVLLADPTLLAQSTLVTPDIPLFFFLLLLLNGLFRNSNRLKLIAVVGLSLISMRAWMVAFVVFAFDMLNSKFFLKDENKKIFSGFLAYVPGGLIALLFLVLHYKAKGWIGYHADSPWAVCFEKVNFYGFLRNIGIYSWRVIDFGRIIWWIFALILLQNIIKYYKSDIQFRKLIILSIMFIVFFPLNMLTYKYLTQHRYFMPIYFFVSLTIIYLLINLKKRKLIIVALFMLLGGNFIIYPDKIAQGWDASLAYLPYINLRNDALKYLNNNKISCQSVKSWFPNLSSLKNTDLSFSENSFSSNALEKCDYCFYSNVFNDISDDEYNQITSLWCPVYNKKLMGIKVILYQNPRNKN
jgi:hypothetical protein